MPVPKEFEGKDLTVYYIDSKGVKEEHKVTVKDGYAIFETTHFSIYSLVANEIKEDKKEEVAVSNIDKNSSNTVTVSNPNTGDNIYSYVGLLVLSMVGIVLVKKNN